MYKKIIILLFIFLPLIAFISCEKNNNILPDFIENDTLVTVKKPNIYLYPQSSIELDVFLGFPKGGGVINSIPDYQNGWHISVEPSGKIDNRYEFLFYEASVPSLWQYKFGWVIPKDSLTKFFKNNFKQAGFIKNEIDDFIEYWVPLLSKNEYYLLYPQFAEQIEPLIEIEMSIQPDNFLRLYYVIKGTENPDVNLELPIIQNFERSGFVAAEWGGILK